MTKSSENAARGRNVTRELYDGAHTPEPQRVNLSSLIIVSFMTLIVGVIAGSVLNDSILKTNDSSDIDFSELSEVYEALADNFDGELDRDKVISEAKRGLVGAAGDTYTYYMTAEEADEFNKDLNGDVGAGVGVEIGERDGYVKVLRTTPGNPAEKAGVKAGDIIYKADGEDISGLTVSEVSTHLRGEAGTTVTLTVVRDNKELSFDLTREVINNVSVYSEYRKESNTAIITITRFDQDTGELARKAANEAKSNGAKKVILDLRGNGGGYVSAAQEVASLWIDGKLVLEQRSANGLSNEKTYAKTGKAVLAGVKTVVLTNGSTASASEIVAGALQDYGLATLIGEKTYGKGSVQALETLKGGDVLRVTIAKWYTPNGNNIDHDGIEPDKVVERTFEQINKEEDPQLDAALKF